MTYFTIEELTASNTATRLGIDNTPTAKVLDNLNATIDAMDQVRELLGHSIHVDSGFRCEALEKVLCEKDFTAWCARHGVAKTTSWPTYFANKGHPQGFCVDFICPDFGEPEDIVAAIKASSLVYDQLIMEGTWVHISFDPKCRMQCMVATFNNGTPTYKAA